MDNPENEKENSSSVTIHVEGAAEDEILRIHGAASERAGVKGKGLGEAVC